MILRNSKWNFDASAGGGFSLGPLTSQTGMFSLNDLSGHTHKYLYMGFGIGHSRGLSSLLRLPRLALPKIIVKNGELSGTGSTTDFSSTGKLFLTDTFKGSDLTDPQSLDGGTVYIEGAAGYLLGVTTSIMLLGLNRALLVMGIAKPEFISVAISSAPAVLLMASLNEGLQNTTGVACLFGEIDYKGIFDGD